MNVPTGVYVHTYSAVGTYRTYVMGFQGSEVQSGVPWRNRYLNTLNGKKVVRYDVKAKFQ